MSCSGDTLDGVTDVVNEVRRMRSELQLGGRGDEKPYLFDHPIDALDPSSALLSLALDDSVSNELRALGAELRFKPMWLEDLVGLAHTLLRVNTDRRRDSIH